VIQLRQAGAGHRLDPFVPPVKGNDRADCFVYRTIEDLEAMTAAGAKLQSGVVVGGGLLGLECAKALRDLGLETNVVEFAPRLMTVQVDEDGGRVCATRSKSWACTCTPAAAPWRLWTAPAPATAWCSTTAATWKPT
jgi:hypothetical protein